MLLTTNLMRKTILTILLLLSAGFFASAQIETVYFEARGSAELNGKQLSMNGEFLNLHVKGHIGQHFSFRLRQRFTKPLYDPKNPLNATDILSLTWHINSKWSLQGGKLPILLGGYEWDDAPIDVYYWNGFCNHVPQVYALGGAVIYDAAPGQQLILQCTSSIFHYGNPNVYCLNLYWCGHITPWWNTMWSVNWMDDPYHHQMGYLCLGNRFEVGPAALELDFMYRRSLKQKKAGFDGSLCARLEVKLGSKFVLFAKGGADYNDAVNVDPNGVAYDLTLPPGERYFFGGGGLEFFPLANKDIRLHAVAYTESETNLFRASLGLTFVLPIIR